MEAYVGRPERWIVVSAAIGLGVTSLVLLVSPSLRSAIVSRREVYEAFRFRERFRPENVGRTCPNYPFHRIAACARAMIVNENRLQYASMTARIFYLSTIAEVATFSDEFARSRTEKVEARTDLLEYLNEEMKLVLVQSGGSVDLSTLDPTKNKEASNGVFGESQEKMLVRKYHANLVDLWIKNWRKDEKYLATNRVLEGDASLRQRLEILRADRDELFSRFSIDLSRYEKRRTPAASEPGPQTESESVSE